MSRISTKNYNPRATGSLRHFLLTNLTIPGGGEREVDGGEEEVTSGQGDHKGGGGVRPELLAAQQSHHRQQIAWRHYHIMTHFKIA